MRLPAPALIGIAAALFGCGGKAADSAAPSASGNAVAPPPASSSGSASAAPASAAPASAAPRLTPPREGGSIAIAPSADALYVADEVRSALRVVKLPLTDDLASAASVTLAGRPAQVVATANLVLVTVRDPGMLLLFAPDPEKGLVEIGRVALPADAWGIAVSADGKTAVVTSAWTHKVSVVDLVAKSVKATHDVAREPRGVAVRADGAAAYVTHLVGTELTRVPLDGSAPTRVALAASPLREPTGGKLQASNGWALALAPDDRRLFAARHAIGAAFEAAWFGAATVDVLLTAKDKPAVLSRAGKPIVKTALEVPVDDANLEIQPAPMAEPRALRYRQKTKTLLVVAEGSQTLTELDASALDPSAVALSTWEIGGLSDPTEPARDLCAGPTGVALSADEATAFVWCPGSGEIEAVDLETVPKQPKGDVHVSRLAPDPLPKLAARGRRIFFDATDTITSGGLACAGCHPEGRDDGHTWMEQVGPKTKTFIFVAGETILQRGYARQTPMLAGRVAGDGPYGWHAQNADLAARATEGMRLHRWMNPSRPWEELESATRARAEALAAFLRTGLVVPPRDARALTPDETRGKELFASADVGCAGCHDPSTEFTNRVAVPLPPRPTLAGFGADPNNAFKTPSLLFIGGTAPYFHDGSEATLEDVIDHNDDRMGKTRQLSEQDKAALVAYLRTL